MPHAHFEFFPQLFGIVIESDGYMNINNGATAALLSTSTTSNRNFKHSSTLTLEIDVCVDFVVQIFEKLPMICGR